MLVPVSAVDRGPLDHRNVLGLVVEEKQGVFLVGTRHGIIRNWFGAADLQLAGAANIAEEDVVYNHEITIRQAVSSESLAGGQGYTRCNCKPSRKQCKTNICKCKKSIMGCTTHCHPDSTCANK